MWILVAMSIVFAAVMAGVMMVSFYVERRSPQNKLQTVVAFSCDLTPAATQPMLPFSANRAQRRAQKATGEVIKLSSTQIHPSVPRTLDKAQLGLDVVNMGNYPISCILFSATTEIEEFEPPRSKFPKNPYLIPARGGRIRLSDNAIDMEQHTCGRLLGKMDVVLKYGYPGKEIYEIHTECKVNMIMEHHGFLSQIIADFTKQAT
jgi:hypothetical protein